MISFWKKMKKNYNCIILCFGFLWAFSFYLTGCSEKKPSQKYSANVLVLDDCDDDNNAQTPPGGDRVLILDPNCELLDTIDGLQVKTRFGENKPLSISEDGRFFAVCENSAKKVTVFSTSTGQEYWSKSWPDKTMNSVKFVNNTLYASNQTTLMVMDIGKKSVKEINGFWGGTWIDLVFDKKNKCFWAAGSVVTKYNKEFEPVFQISSICDRKIAAAFSIDVTSDGSVWIAVREVIAKDGLENKLLKISPEGDITKTIQLDVCPYCLSVDQSDDSIWVTGMTSSKDYTKVGDEWPETLTELNETIASDIKTYTHKYNSEGDRIVEMEKGGYSIAIDPFDKSVWIAGRNSIIHSSGSGDIINEYNNVSKQYKWIALEN